MALDPPIENLKSVCLFLGPYRNLTTLTAGILSLHPTCQVLNHGMKRVFPRPGDNFLVRDSRDGFQRFLRAALRLSQGGRRGDEGGAITLSHAFDHGAMRDAYRRRYGESLLKEDIQCLVWKESLRTSNTIRNHGVDPGALFARNPELRFLMPIRNPMDTARSNLRTGHHEIFRALDEKSPGGILDAVLEEIAWFLDQQKLHPDRFFCYHENEFGEPTLADLAGFLEIPLDAAWIREALSCYHIQSAYTHDEAILAQYRRCVDLHFTRHPRHRRKLLEFLG